MCLEASSVKRDFYVRKAAVTGKPFKLWPRATWAAAIRFSNYGMV